jgi:hypothetical protein
MVERAAASRWRESISLGKGQQGEKKIVVALEGVGGVFTSF